MLLLELILTHQIQTGVDQLTQRDKDIEDLKKNAGDADDLKTKLDTLQKKYDTDTAEFQSKLDARDYADAVRAGIAAKGIKFTSKAAEKAFIADLTANKLEMKDGTLTGFDDYCKKQQESDPAAFQSEKPAPTFANPIQNPAPHAVSAAGLAAQRYSAQFAPKGKE